MLDLLLHQSTADQIGILLTINLEILYKYIMNVYECNGKNIFMR